MCVIYPPKSIKIHSCAVVSDRTVISGLNTGGGGGGGGGRVGSIAQLAGRAITSGVQAAMAKLRDGSCD